MAETLAETVYNSLKRDIDSMTLSSNEFLVEQGVAERYGVSKAPVRSALQRLCMEGRLVSHPRKGYLIVSLTARELRQVQELRFLNEGQGLALLLKEADETALRAILAGTSDKCTMEENEQWHTQLAALTGNHFLVDVVARLAGTASRPLCQKLDDHNSGWSVHHRDIAVALLDRNLDRALEFLRRDLELLD